MNIFKKYKMIDKIDADLAEKLNADANATVSRNTFVVAIFCCFIFVVEELTRIQDNKSWIMHVLVDCTVILIVSFLPFILKKLKVREALIMHTLAMSYVVAISTIIITFDGSKFGGITVWGNVLIMVFISMCYYSTSIFWVYSFIFGLFWITIFTVKSPFLWTYIDLSDHVGRYAIFLIMSGIAFWGNKMIRRQFLDNQKQLLLIQKYSKELEEKNEELQRLDNLKNEFLANTTHELKTPLHSIIGLLEPILESKNVDFSDEELYDISLAVSSAKRLSGLVQDILDFSKLRNQDIIIQKQDVDIYILTDMVCKSFEHQTRNKMVKLINDIDPNLDLIYVDENRLLQILFNLIGNALKFTNSGEIRITAVKFEDQIQITVSDTGIGIAQEQMRYIFNAFEQADSSISRKYGGTGLGLSITKSLVELHGGTLWVESIPGAGSQFMFSIPVRKDDVKISISEVLPQKKWENELDLDYDIQTVEEPTLNGDNLPRVLVVDDEPINIRIMSNILTKEGYQPIPAYSGKEALDLLNNGLQYDLVLLDIMMPQMSGFDVCIEIRKLYTLSQLPILLLTARNINEDLVVGFNVGANDYLQKPFNNKELKARIKTLIELKRTTEVALSAELYFLQSQIKPHFLYNALNTIVSYIRTDSDLAREMIIGLSEYLRENFNVPSMEKTMPILKEISIIKSYLFIEMARFKDKLKVEYDIDESIKCNVPHLVLQPIVENAVRHGILEKQLGGTVRISVKYDGEDVLLTVEDDGVGLNAELIPKLLQNKVDGVGIGLYNVQRRMMAIYGHGLEIESDPGHGTKVQLRISH
ncbi:ATP-binding protein [Anaerovorax odorimutans]|uniref:ATP-binding protein n=1 Tax=Anaerovorax odorimutans TaxID=109327 RepID=UPI0004186411|nr:ATP-binding protein [Anaerovorax odorimutans]